MELFKPYGVKGLLRSVMAAAAAITAPAILTSCDAVIDDALPECREGLEVRFIYDYNMEWANAFPSQSHCLTLYVYDKEGRLVKTQSETGEPLADEGYRMHVDLEPGEYTLMAYSGLDCADASFSFTSDPETTLLPDLDLRLRPSLLEGTEGHRLHTLLWGRVEATVPEGETLEYTTVTVPMMKDTNNIRVMLCNLSGEPLGEDDFTVDITDDNTLLSSATNDVLPAGEVTYRPWTKGTASAGVLPDGAESVIAFSELSTSRLIAGHDARLVVTRTRDDRRIIDVPLINFLLLLKSQEFERLGSQEFLDRESRWALTFFLQGDGSWMNVYIRINDWIVRINNTEF